MNIFYLDKDPVIAAQMSCDRHVVKMILESAQMLSTAHRVCDGDEYADKMGLYKLSHKNHPSSIWVRSSNQHYKWLYDHFIALCKEYNARYMKHHATERLIYSLEKQPQFMPVGGFKDPPQCMPDYCKNEDTVIAYQTYYILEKSSFAKWNHSKIPYWWKDGENYIINFEEENNILRNNVKELQEQLQTAYKRIIELNNSKQLKLNFETSYKEKPVKNAHI